MRLVKLILSLLPLVYIGWLLIHFTSFDGWSDGMLAGGLGPTVLGLGAIGLMLCVPVIVKLLKMVLVPSDVARVKPGQDLPASSSDFDADAALARYLDRKAAGEVDMTIPQDTPRPVFGRKTG